MVVGKRAVCRIDIQRVLAGTTTIAVKNKRIISIAMALLAMVFVVIACLAGARLYELVQTVGYTAQQLAWQLVYAGGSTIIALGLFIGAYEAESEWRARRVI